MLVADGTPCQVVTPEFPVTWHHHGQRRLVAWCVPVVHDMRQRPGRVVLQVHIKHMHTAPVGRGNDRNDAELVHPGLTHLGWVRVGTMLSGVPRHAVHHAVCIVLVVDLDLGLLGVCTHGDGRVSRCRVGAGDLPAA